MMTLPRAVATVWAAALVALCLLLLPGDWRGLAALPAFAWWAAWSLLGQHHRALHALDRELDDQADELDGYTVEPWPPMEPSKAEPWPDEADDPVGYYAMRARRYVEPWQQRGPGEQPHVIVRHVPHEPGLYCPICVELSQAVELDHTRVVDVQSAELDTIWPDTLDQKAEALTEHTRASFDLIRRMFL